METAITRKWKTKLPDWRFPLFVFALSVPSPVMAVNWDWNATALPAHSKTIAKANECYSQGDVDSAIVHLQQAKGQSQDDCRVRHVLVDIYSAQKRYPEAKSELADLIALEQRLNSVTASARPMYTDIPQLKVEMGQLLEAEGDYFGAVQSYKDAAALSDVERQKNWMIPRLGIGRCYEAQGEWSLARQYYEQAMKDPNISTDVRNVMQQKLEEIDRSSAAAPSRSGGDEGASGSGGQPRVDSSPSGFGSGGGSGVHSPGGHQFSSGSSEPAGFPSGGGPSAPAPVSNRPAALTRAIAEMSLKNYENAVVVLKAYIAGHKNSGDAHYLLGVCYDYLKQKTEAAKEYEAAINFATSIKMQKTAADALKKLSRP